MEYLTPLLLVGICAVDSSVGKLDPSDTLTEASDVDMFVSFDVS